MRSASSGQKMPASINGAADDDVWPHDRPAALIVTVYET